MADRWRLYIFSSKNNHALLYMFSRLLLLTRPLFDLLFVYVFILRKNVMPWYTKELLLFFYTEAEHGYASSLPMPIEDYGSSPTPSGSSSSSATTSSTTRPIKIKKNQGSRSVFLRMFSFVYNWFSNSSIFLNFKFGGHLANNRSTHNELEKNRWVSWVLEKKEKGGSNKPYAPPFLLLTTTFFFFESRDFVTSTNRWRRAGHLSFLLYFFLRFKLYQPFFFSLFFFGSLPHPIFSFFSLHYKSRVTCVCSLLYYSCCVTRVTRLIILCKAKISWEPFDKWTNILASIFRLNHRYQITDLVRVLFPYMGMTKNLNKKP